MATADSAVFVLYDLPEPYIQKVECICDNTVKGNNLALCMVIRYNTSQGNVSTLILSKVQIPINQLLSPSDQRYP
ncbi:unnamed protein product [Dovyalis caffra]|uniref:Uncharacterized protein n=1 Tax=Dovyalis caffra TaxID=77055 RepID=A0AAV1R1C4_9ROSI|nr:unnamed protein product [Dovyalis caffra]